MGKYVRLLVCAAVMSAAVPGCRAGRTAETVNLQESEKAEEPLSSAPAIRLTDVLSGTVNEYEVISGNYDWNYRDGDQMTSVKACGSHPLYEAQEKDRLKLPRYNRMDYVCYSISCVKHPDRLTVNEYSVDDIGNMDARPLTSRVYEDAPMAELKPGFVYELIVEWDEGNQDTNGFYGTASYVVVTE